MFVAHTARRVSSFDEVLAHAVNQMQAQGVTHLDAGIEDMELPCSIAKQSMAQCINTFFTDILGVKARRRL